MTDGTEHPGGAAAPGQDPRNTQPTMPDPRVSAQVQPPEAVPPQDPGPGAAAPGSYGYPPQAPVSGYGYPGPQGQFPQQGGFQAPPQFQQPPQSQFSPGPQQFGNPAAEPDWEALADQGAAQARRRRRLWTLGIVALACVLGVGVGAVVIKGVNGNEKPSATGSPSASASGGSASASGAPGSSPTVPGQPNLLADGSGQANLAVGPDAQVSSVQNGFVLRLRSNGNSFAQSANPVIDVAKSFSVSAWVYNEAAEGPRSAISQGDGISYSFDLGRDDVNGRKSWVFRVQTADGGADATAVQVLSDNINTVGAWVLLTGVYDADQHSIALYVNGAPAGTAAVPAVWAGPGPLQLGRNRHHGIWGSYWAGVIGHIKVWDKPLSPAQAAALKDGGGGAGAVKPIGSWLVG
ncbi:hypothetical protein OG871_18460 [Kitasatospora sp. NBC_00374]|uniref:LamG domain-containing protein n=1 Tax=Kitasatospora sp. NBC_00374 TaxID=2975964 RepID=UPI003254F840